MLVPVLINGPDNKNYERLLATTRNNITLIYIIKRGDSIPNYKYQYNFESLLRDQRNG